MRTLLLLIIATLFLPLLVLAQAEYDETHVYESVEGKRIGIYGGTFDPPHEGHLAAVQAAIEQQHLDQVIIVVSESTGRKADKLSLKVRTRLAELNFGSVKQVRFMTYSELQEMRRLGGSAGFIDSFAKSLPKTSVFPIVGTDVVDQIRDKKYSYSTQPNVTYVGNSRDGKPITDFGPVKGVTTYPKTSTSSTEIRDALSRGVQPEGMNNAVFGEIQRKGYHFEKPQSCADMWSALLDAAK